MKKTLLSIAVVLASMAGLSAAAQSQVQPRGAAKAECTQTDCKNAKCDAPAKICPFDGLNLTEKQQADLKALCPAKPSKEERRAARCENRREYLAKVKAILTPEQYVQFLENSYVNRMAPRGDMRKGHNNKMMKAKRGAEPRKMKGAKGAERVGAPAAATLQTAEETVLQVN